MTVAGDVVLSARPTDLLWPGGAAGRRVVLAATMSWEQGCVQEPSVWHHGGAWHMCFTGGWSNAGIGYATAANPQGPWTKHPVPVLGLGAGGMALNVSAHMEHYEDGTVYSYYPSSPGGGDLMVATASAAAPTVFTTRGVALAVSGQVAGIVNTHLYRRGTGDYVLMFESKSPQAWPQWQMGYATGTSPLGPFTVAAFPLPTLSRGDSTAMYGGPWLTRQDGEWVLFYHAAPKQNLPTEIYRATSADLVTWTPTASPIIRRVLSGIEVDQVADFTMAANPAGGPSYAFWSAQDNVKPSGHIIMAVPRCPTRQWDGAQWTTVSPDQTGDSRQVRASLPANVSVAGVGAWVDVPGLVLTYTPSRAEVFTLTGSCLTSTAAAQSYYVRVGASPVPVGYPAFDAYHEAAPAGRPSHDTFPFSGELEAGVSYSWSLQVQSTTALTVYGGSQLSIVTSPR